MYKNRSYSKLPRRAEPEESTFTIAMTLTSPFLGLDMTNLKFPDISRFLVFYNSEYDSKGKGELTWPTKEKGQGYKKRGRGPWQWHKLWMTHVNNKEDELITPRDDSWSFQQDPCLSNTQIGIDTYYFSSFCGCSAWTATSSKGCQRFKEHQSMSHNSAFKEASTSYYINVPQHWKCMNVIRRQMSKLTHI